MVAHMGLFARMSPRVDCKCAALDETLVATGEGAMVWTLVCVNAIVPA
jgi:hypothetical protein